jgi:signal peptidase I
MVFVGLAAIVALSVLFSAVSYAVGALAMRSKQPLHGGMIRFAAIHFAIGTAIFLLSAGVIGERAIPLLSLFALILMFGAFRTLSALAVWRAIAGYIITLVLIGITTTSLVYIFNSTIGRMLYLPAGAGAMAPTLTEGDRFLVDYHRQPKRWDIIAFDSPVQPGTIWVSRLVGLPGERVEIVGGTVLINGATVATPRAQQEIRYIGSPGPGPICNGCQGSPLTLGQGEYFVLGDNTAASLDSRYWKVTIPGASGPGALPADRLIGVAVFLYAPFKRAGPLH